MREMLQATHCEFVATHRRTGKKFSVEAKMRRPDKALIDVGNQLYAALKKDAEFKMPDFRVEAQDLKPS